MGCLVSKPETHRAIIDEETCLLTDTHISEQPNEVTNQVSYDDLTLNRSQKIKDEERLQLLTVETANKLINVSEQSFFINYQPAKEVSKEYKNLLLEFDKTTDMSQYLPPVKGLGDKYIEMGRTDFDICKVLLSNEKLRDDVKFINQAADNVADALDSFHLVCENEIFVSLTTKSSQKNTN
ncbi:hypothetical protein AX774_g4459 [Zancudomyces culisetae]|uniref:Uncharacterized protein n=1 Tax=Zancudomyces culisetae TaxID=1213189 RepID=A0A1R1PM86_ZANCU|nr:hypothetical protein AX774_g4459 [Zancudomyces culisetae]|eukprot:OMH82074.1 hypothetical protein AX774_g4459 [Zancudomyces culisetae]